MVEEGELKKRIKALAEPDEEIFPYSSLEYRIDEIIDEAKKEFPLPSEAEEGCAQYSIDVIKWFKKWFGDKE